MGQTEIEDGMEERIELSLLYDFYGALLKENQRRMFEACILEDYNFTEIAEEESISRQGVYDAIKRTTKQLRGYEEKLGLVAKFDRQKQQVKELQENLQQLRDSELSCGNKQDAAWKRVFGILSDLLEL